VAQQGTFAIAGHAVAKDQVMHSAADIDGIDLHIAEVQEGLADRGRRLVEQERLPQKAAGGLRGDADGGRHGGKCMDSAGRGQARAQ
jgi:hypothetical protein